MANTHSLDLEVSSSQYASITDASQTGLDLTGDFTIECWVKPETLTGSDAIVGKFATGQLSYQLFVSSTAILINTSSNGTGGNQTSQATTISTGEWTHVAVSFTASTGTTTFYKDGVSLGTGATGVTSIHNGTAPFEIGAYRGTPQFDGLIDEVRVWNDVRTESEIQDNLGVELSLIHI